MQSKWKAYFGQQLASLCHRLIVNTKGMRIGFGDAMRIAGEKKHHRDFSKEDSKVTKQYGYIRNTNCQGNLAVKSRGNKIHVNHSKFLCQEIEKITGCSAVSVMSGSL